MGSRKGLCSSEPERYARISVPLHKVSGVREQGCEVGAQTRSNNGWRRIASRGAMNCTPCKDTHWDAGVLMWVNGIARIREWGARFVRPRAEPLARDQDEQRLHLPRSATPAIGRRFF